MVLLFKFISFFHQHTQHSLLIPVISNLVRPSDLNLYYDDRLNVLLEIGHHFVLGSFEWVLCEVPFV
jgi:hypothetical protein